jgi:DNA-binding NtrC family response regulator
MTEDELSSNVLLVDDEEQFLDTLSQRLELRGIKVDTVTGGEEAMEKITAKKFDAIVLDLVMPGIDGMETLKRLKEKNPDIQIIMLTGKATVKKGIEAMKLGAEEFLEKPVDLNVLMEKIKKATHNKMLLVEKSRQEEVKKILKKKGW